MTRPRSRADVVRHRWSVAARALAALPGGYALAALLASALALLSSAPREEAVAAAALPAYAVHLAAAIWAFWARTAARAWLGVGAPALALALLVWWLRAARAS